MEANKQVDLLICGGGGAGLQLARALSQDSFFDSFSITVIEKERKNKNDRTWCYWEKNQGEWDPIVTQKWKKARFNTNDFTTDFDLHPYVYKMIRGADFYHAMQKQLSKASNITLLQDEIVHIQPKDDHCLVSTKQHQFKSKRVFSSLLRNDFRVQKKYPVLQQHFIGWFVETQHPIFDPSRLIFMDFSLPQRNSTRFMYVLPFTKNYALVEYTLFSKDLLDREAYEREINTYLQDKQAGKFTIKETEQGSIPMTAFDFTKHNTPHLLHIGTAGGWTKASTGFTFKKSQQKIKELVPFLKKAKPLNQFKQKSKFNFYDLLFLDVLAKHNEQGSQLFSRMFERNSPQLIFQFLEEKTLWRQEVSLMLSFPVRRFVVALWNRLFRL